MSSMLEQAIIDAADLKEAAKRSAEEKIIEHFSDDIKEAVNMILEQEELGMPTLAATDPYDPMAAASPTAFQETPVAPGLIDIEGEDADQNKQGDFVVKQTPYATTTSEKEFVSIDLNKLEESIQDELQESEDLLDEEKLDEDLLDEDTYDLDEAVLEEEGWYGSRDSEDSDPQLEEMIRNILSEEAAELFEESETSVSGAPSDSDTLEEEQSPVTTPELQVQNESAEVELKSKNKTLIKEQKILNSKIEKLNEQNTKYQSLVQQMKETIQKTNLSNARLLYQNRVLNSSSLNERQKDRLVETIANAETVEEAKIIYETLQSAVGASSRKRKPKSLNEVVTKRSSAFMPRKEEKKVDAFSDRMKILAGLK